MRARAHTHACTQAIKHARVCTFRFSLAASAASFLKSRNCLRDARSCIFFSQLVPTCGFITSPARLAGAFHTRPETCFHKETSGAHLAVRI